MDKNNSFQGNIEEHDFRHMFVNKVFLNKTVLYHFANNQQVFELLIKTADDTRYRLYKRFTLHFKNGIHPIRIITIFYRESIIHYIFVFTDRYSLV